MAQDKVVEYRQQLEESGRKVEQLTRAANQAEIRFNDTNEVLKTLEERLRITEVRFVTNQRLSRIPPPQFNCLLFVPAFMR